MRADFKVVLDACVLANYGVCDLLLRLAEKPRLYLPRWSEDLLTETRRTHVGALRWPQGLADSFQAALREQFPESLVGDYGHLIERCANDPKDRHVLACAIQSQAELILTFNLSDFPAAALSPWKVAAQHPQDYLLMLYGIDPVLVLHKLEGAAQKRACSLEDHLIDLGIFLPAFAQRLLEAISAAE
jgi:predicted nucleic acid-binding protein